MAKWGEGDPRWRVEHREDGRNVNNWHWSEVNKMEWTKQRLGELLPGAEASSSGASEAAPHGWVARVKKVKSVAGEVGARTFTAAGLGGCWPDRCTAGRSMRAAGRSAQAAHALPPPPDRPRRC